MPSDIAVIVEAIALIVGFSLKVLTENQTQIDDVAQTLSKSLEFPILDRPEDVAYLDSAYFDSRYHLNQDAARQRTIALIDRLSPHLPIAHHENSPDRP